MTAAAVDRLRIGCVQYLNARPLIDGWSGAVVFDHPAALCDRLAAGELDVALVSSFEYLRNPQYAIVDGVAIASDGPVYSVFVASQDELSNLTAIELDPASLTSVNLLRVLLAERGLEIPLVPRRNSAESPLDARHGRLLIGDQAIRFRQNHESGYRITDLGELWKELTDLPFVYALWLVQPAAVDTSTAEELRRLRDQNLNPLADLADEQAFSAEFCRFYWRDRLRFDFSEREKAGLLKFRSLCQSHGILPRNESPLRLL